MIFSLNKYYLYTTPGVTVSGGLLLSLAPGASDNSTFTGSYTLTQADIDNGSFTNQATATGTGPNGNPVSDAVSDDPTTATPDDPTETPLPQAPSLSLEKTGTWNDDGDGIAEAGEAITYAFTVTNTGNVTLTNITVSDLTPGVTVSGGPLGSLAPGASDNSTFTASYTLTQADIDAGSFSNQATATGDDPNGNPVDDTASDDPTTPAPDDPTVTPLPQSPGISLEKSGTWNDDGDGIAEEGETITYAFMVTNTGNVTLTNITVTDPTPGVTVSGGPLLSLAPGASDNSTFTGSYTLTQADIDNGSFSNQASATGNDPNGGPVEDTASDDPTTATPDDPTVTTIPQSPDLTLTKLGNFNDLNGNGFADVGETITYTYSVANTGNVTVSNIVINDPTLGVVNSLVSPSTLAPGQSGTLSGLVHTITQADITAGYFENTATAEGLGPNGNPVTDVSDAGDELVETPGGQGNTDNDPTNDPTVTPLPQNPELTVSKASSLSLGTDGIPTPGDVAFYTIVVANTGNLPATGITLTDTNIDAGSLNLGCTTAFNLNPGQSKTCSATYSLTQADIDAGYAQNTAIANGTDSNGDPVSDVSDPDDELTETPDGEGVTDGDPTNDPTVTPLQQLPSLSLIKNQTSAGNAVGELVTYEIVVTNTGNVTVSNTEVTDPNATITGGSPIVSLAPGASATVTAEHLITLADISAGYVENTATATGDSPAGTDDVTDTSDAGTGPDGNPVNDPESVATPNGDGTPGTPDPTDDPTVTRIALPPVATDNESLANAPGPVTQEVILEDDGFGSDFDPDGTLVPGSIDLAPGTTGQQTTLTVAGEGSWTVDGNGNVTFTPEAGFTDDPTPITYTIEDNEGLVSNPATIRVDYVPIATDDTSLDNIVGSAVTVDVLANDNTGDAANPTTVQILGTPNPGDPLVVAGEGTWSVDPLTGAITFTPEAGFTGDPAPIQYTVDDDEGNTSNPATVTLDYLCVTIEAWVYLEGAAVFSDGSENYALPMRANLNGLRLLPGQTLEDLFLGVQYTPAGQPYDIAPWNYFGAEGDNFDSMGDPLFGDAGYPSTVVDWVLVSLRDNPNGAGGPICQAAALLHEDGSIQFVDDFDCCDVDLGQSYYLVIEHRNHLIVMSHEPIAITAGVISYDFRVQQSYLVDPFGFGYVGQKEILPGVWAMHGGNGNQTLSGDSDTDINFDDRTYWEAENGDIAKYRTGDYNLNGDTNFNDRRVWELNNGKFTSVPRD